MSFNQLSEKTLLKFSQTRRQTPTFGPLVNSGDKGGSFFFRLKSEDDLNFIKSVQIPLEISSQIKIDSSFHIPFFNRNKYFQNDFINVFIQQLAYSIVSEVRSFFAVDEDYPVSKNNEIEYYLEVSFTIETLNENFLSITINRNDYFGGLYPNYYVYTINFTYKPERKVSIYELVNYGEFKNLENYLASLIDKYGENEHKELLKNIQRMNMKPI